MVSEGVIGTGLVTLGTIIGAIFTRRSAKDQTAVGGFTALTAAMTTELERRDKIQSKLEARITKLEAKDEERDRLGRRHQAWDRMAWTRLQQITGEDIPEPPPLELDDEDIPA